MVPALLFSLNVSWSSVAFHRDGLHSFVKLHRTALCGCSVVYSAVLLWVDLWVQQTFIAWLNRARHWG